MLLRFFQRSSPPCAVHGKIRQPRDDSANANQRGSPLKRASRLILLSVCIGQTIVGLDQRAMTVALPTLTTTFNTAFTTIQWTILVYDLVLIGLIITMGRLGDLFGRRRFYSLGFLIFVTASAVCGMTQTTGQLIFFRAVQAIGGSMIAANGRAIVSVNLPAEERGRGLGLTVDGVSHRLSHRPRPRWILDRQSRLALDFLHQHAVQPGRRLSSLESRPGDPDAKAKPRWISPVRCCCS